jgi:hypothetical protein
MSLPIKIDDAFIYRIRQTPRALHDLIISNKKALKVGQVPSGQKNCIRKTHRRHHSAHLHHWT